MTDAESMAFHRAAYVYQGQSHRRYVEFNVLVFADWNSRIQFITEVPSGM